jgi:hypothetical protein
MIFAVDNDVGTWAGLAGNLVNIGFAAIVGWYLLTRALPAMQQAAQEEQGRQRKDHLEEQGRLRQEFREALKAVTDHCDREMDRRDRVMGEFAKIMEELKQAVRVLPPADRRGQT